MKKFQLWSSLVLALILTSCAFNRQDPFMQIQPGMEAFQVQQLLGDPIDRAFVGEHQQWFYKEDLGKGVAKTKVVILDGGKVVALGDDEVEAERQFEIARAQAAAPKVVQPYGLTQAQGTSSGFVGGGLLCTDHNKYGDYAHGGGCNEYGCWSPGGSCSQYGCTARGECGEKECKDRVPSYQCVKK